MRAGQLRHRVIVQKREVDSDTGGLTAWSDYTTVWAAVEDLSGREYIQARQLGEASLVTTCITTRYRNDLKSNMRIVWNNNNYEIKAILDPDGRRRVLQIMCMKAEE